MERCKRKPYIHNYAFQLVNSDVRVKQGLSVYTTYILFVARQGLVFPWSCVHAWWNSYQYWIFKFDGPCLKMLSLEYNRTYEWYSNYSSPIIIAENYSYITNKLWSYSIVAISLFLNAPPPPTTISLLPRRVAVRVPDRGYCMWPTRVHDLSMYWCMLVV